MARKEKAETPDAAPRGTTREQITAYFKKRTGFCAKGATDLKYLVRQHCSAAGVGDGDEAMALMAAGLSTYNHADYAPPPLPED